MMVDQETKSAVLEQIRLAVIPIPQDDRLGFLFWIIIGGLRYQGMSAKAIRNEILKGLDLALGELDN
jgi:hypothetical protein